MWIIYDGADIAYEGYVGAVQEKTHFVHGTGVDGHLGLSRNGQSYFYLTDGLGSVAKIVDAAKNVVQSYSYDSYGLPQATTGFRNSFTFTGREWDGDLGLLYLRARYYDPIEGIFISKDPLGWTADVNVYRYVGGNPGNAVDPWGLFKLFGKEINLNAGAGLQGGIQALLLGLNGSVGGVIGTDGQRCGVITICGRIGPGLYAGGGAYGAVGGTLNNTSNVGGWSFGGGGDAGWGASTGGQATVGPTSASGVGPIPKVKFGGGFGANAGVDVCYTFTVACSSCPSK